ncbi:MAG TPA: ABC transporter permease [Blastocatellia bacterium]|nr:ABC transporter permease [Blastocatellia bacterium]HMV83597.1 ABC transporter permease [Blastocatellia bacterium]HMX26595.1 ABC transporter permease [Blastocatellia bacterium]HMY70768.1 ABC transporter permease [Blastocatellia bacterium]HMZ22139.1 ABC transporter permease [Blastocatellia bacterium]
MLRESSVLDKKPRSVELLAEPVNVSTQERPHRIKFGLSRWGEALRVAAASIFANRLRSLLTVIGVVIGVAVVTLIAALLEGAENYIKQTAAELGPGVARIDKAAFQDFLGDGQAFAEAQSKRPDVTIDDLKALQERLRDRMEVGAQIDAALPVQRGNNSLQGIAVQGTTPNIVALTTIKVERGRQLTDFDDEYRRPVCVIGADIEEFLFTDRDPVGQFIKVGSAEYEVIGVAAKRGSLFGASQDGFVQLPLGTFAKVFGARSRSISLLAKSKPEAGIPNEEVEDLVRFAMRTVRRLQPGEAENFSIVTAKSVEKVSKTLTNLVALILYPLTGIALVVGGIVVMNMMLASVTERTREIGIRLAIGARRKDILAQFLIESTLLTLAGGLFGVVASTVVVWTAAKLSGLSLSMPLWALLAAVMVSCLVGIVFGVFPARRASKLDPIEALRKE